MPIIKTPKPPPDESPHPDRTTYQRLYLKALCIAQAVQDRRAEFRAMSPHFARDPSRQPQNAHAGLDADMVKLCNDLIDFAADVRVGKIPLDPEFLDAAAGKGARPIIDVCEAAEAQAKNGQAPEPAALPAPKSGSKSKAIDDVIAVLGSINEAKQEMFDARVDAVRASWEREEPAPAPAPASYSDSAPPLWAKVEIHQLGLTPALLMKLQQTGVKTLWDIELGARVHGNIAGWLNAQDVPCSPEEGAEIQQTIADVIAQANSIAPEPSTNGNGTAHGAQPPKRGPGRPPKRPKQEPVGESEPKSKPKSKPAQLAPILYSWDVLHGAPGGPFTRVCIVKAHQSENHQEAHQAAIDRIGWQVHNFPMGLAIMTGKGSLRISADREWIPVGAALHEPYDATEAGILPDGEDLVPDVCPSGEPRLYQVFSSIGGKKHIKGMLKAVNRKDAESLAKALYPAQGVRVEPIKEEVAKKREVKRENGREALAREFERDARRKERTVEQREPEVEAQAV